MRSLVLYTCFLAAVISAITAYKVNSCETTSKPNFATGLRISEQKCREYNWIRKNLEKCSSSQDTSITKYPYLGALGYRKADEHEDQNLHFLCSSFLVSQKFALSAAHCTKISASFPYKSPEIVRLGSTDIKTTDVPHFDAKIIRIVVHPDHVRPIKRFDLAFIELESEIQFTRSILPVCLWSQPDFPETASKKVPNFGSTEAKTEPTGVLSAPEVQFVDNETCQPFLKNRFTRHWSRLEDHQICVNESISTVRICQGAAGSPVVSEVSLDGNSDDKMPYVLGVTSFGFGCDGGIAIYTRIPSFVDWIEKNVF